MADVLPHPGGPTKRIAGLEFLFSSKEKGIYVSFEDSIEKINSVVEQFGWQNKKNVKILKYDPYKLDDIFEVIENSIRESGYSRVVIDSISSLSRPPDPLATVV